MSDDKDEKSYLKYMEVVMHEMVSCNDVVPLEILLKKNPKLDVNAINAKDERTILGRACKDEKISMDMFKFIVHHPRIDLNTKSMMITFSRCTPFIMSVYWSRGEVVKYFLDYCSFNIQVVPDGWKFKNLAILGFGLSIAKMVLASQRDLGDLQWDADEFYFSLLEEFQRDPVTTRFNLRRELGYGVMDSAQMHILVQYLQDGFFRLKGPISRLSRFMLICIKLPLEIRFMIYTRIYSSPKQYVTDSETQDAFKSLYANGLIE